MTRQYHLEAALLPQGWTHGALVTVADDGHITTIQTPDGGRKREYDRAVGETDRGVSSESGGQACKMVQTHETERVAGIIVPGMPNAHSHAFQRGMAGNTEYRLSARDSFWTWRQAMYALANQIEPADLQILATQLFIEMLKSGYTSVAEFHYLHRRPAGDFYPPGKGLWEAIIAAATATGIGLTLLPTLYQTADFGAQPLKPEQARFALETEWFLRAIEDRIGTERRSASPTLRTGAAFHSLRAVPLATLRDAALALRQIDATLPLHIHVAEQVKEVESCKLETGRRPIELLLETGLLDPHWCLVHATHATAIELQGIASSGATVCASISTEANLGDGFFDAARFLKLGGRICVGSDSQSTVCPAEELRWMEYQARLRKRRRGVLADKLESHVGTRLWRDAAQHGAQAIGQPAGAIAVGRRADWLVLDRTHPSMAGAAADTALDHLVFAGGNAAIRDVMVAGRWVLKDGHHAAELPLRGHFSALMTRLAGTSSDGDFKV
jgi:formimidoylglutamate deiminase